MDLLDASARRVQYGLKFGHRPSPINGASLAIKQAKCLETRVVAFQLKSVE